MIDGREMNARKPASVTAGVRGGAARRGEPDGAGTPRVCSVDISAAKSFRGAVAAAAAAGTGSEWPASGGGAGGAGVIINVVSPRTLTKVYTIYHQPPLYLFYNDRDI